ncbi:inducible metalloproteinase inhibitor protein-like [Hyposmocoma kahamanoa]|uniref:inducible metalloproteinase inhibitor protein-like n=1 Tax=Hyposmocoma kahamanoa TaxID=1477025 RepID=UPI000E6D7D40|nr:inducible metalloproteinase inhibitor protein-like [Hyposmocoma kahamanoa]
MARFLLIFICALVYVVYVSGESRRRCKRNEEYSSDPICPPDTCASIVSRYNCINATSPPFRTGCKCKSGYLRLTKDSPCVRYCNCPQLPHGCCPRNEEYSPEPICPPDLCISILADYNCEDLSQYRNGCKCISGYLRQEETSRCIPAEQCKL